MKRIAIVMMVLLGLLFLPACGGVQLAEETEDVILDTSAATIGYLVGKNNPEEISRWVDWGMKMLVLESGDPVGSYNELLILACEFTLDDPFLKLQMGKLFALLEFPDLPIESYRPLVLKHVVKMKVVVSGFLDGLFAAEEESG